MHRAIRMYLLPNMDNGNNTTRLLVSLSFASGTNFISGIILLLFKINEVLEEIITWRNHLSPINKTILTLHNLHHFKSQESDQDPNSRLRILDFNTGFYCNLSSGSNSSKVRIQGSQFRIQNPDSGFYIPRQDFNLSSESRLSDLDLISGSKFQTLIPTL